VTESPAPICAAQATASVTAQNFLQPADDLGFRVDYKHPYLWGPADRHKTALNATAFNSRKMSGVFTPGAPTARAGCDAVPGGPGCRCRRSRRVESICAVSRGADRYLHAAMSVVMHCE
jgi:hypothetical protein